MSSSWDGRIEAERKEALGAAESDDIEGIFPASRMPIEPLPTLAINKLRHSNFSKKSLRKGVSKSAKPILTAPALLRREAPRYLLHTSLLKLIEEFVAFYATGVYPATHDAQAECGRPM
jgi:hypothetical protein